MSDIWVRELVGEDVLMKGKLGAVSTVSTAAWENKVVALYFSASWCPPCQEFTPRLVGIYTEAQRKHKDFELIFVSHDKTIEQFQDYFVLMPWSAVPFEDKQRRERLADKFGIRGIPHLVLLDKNGIVNGDAQAAVWHDTQADKFPWHGPPGTAKQDDLGRTSFWKTVIWALLLWAAFKYFYSR